MWDCLRAPVFQCAPFPIPMVDNADIDGNPKYRWERSIFPVYCLLVARTQPKIRKYVCFLVLRRVDEENSRMIQDGNEGG